VAAAPRHCQMGTSKPKKSHSKKKLCKISQQKKLCRYTIFQKRFFLITFKMEALKHARA